MNIAITEIEWYESKNSPSRISYFLNRPSAGYFISESPMFNTVGILYIPETRERIIYTN